jgi:hypothetical protein
VFLDEAPKEWGHLKAVALGAICDQIGDFLRRVACPSFGYIECKHSDRIIVLTIEEIDHQCG